MKYAEFKVGVENGQCFPVYLFEGEDAFFRERGFSLLKNKFVQEPDLNLTVLDASCTPEQLVDSLNGYPFMSEKRLTVIRDFYPKQEFVDGEFENYLKNPSPFSILVILNEKPCDAFKKQTGITTVDCNRQDVATLLRWVKAQCFDNGVTIDGQTAKLICEFCLSDMTRIENETEKLCAYVGSGGTITVEDVNQMVAKDSEYKIYQMTDYVARGKFDQALTVIKDMMAKKESSQMILTAIYNYYRKLLHASISDLTTAQLMKAFGSQEYAIIKLKEQSKKFKTKSLKKAVDLLTDADYKIKSGLAEADERMWLTVFSIMADK